MNNTNSLRIIKPNDCVLGFGIPTSKDVFFEDQNNPNKDFARKFNGIWSKYYAQFVSEVEYFEPLLKNTGLKIIYNLKLSDLEALYRENTVVLLFSHWKNDSVEFYDGLFNIHDIVEKIPIDFNGITDLCVCHPNNLAMLIRNERPNSLTKFITIEATPNNWLNFYHILFNHLKENDLSYFSALKQVINEFFKSKKNESNKINF